MIEPRIGEIAAYRTAIGGDDIALFDNIAPEFASAIGSRGIAERARAIFPDLTLDVFDERHHFDPPHRIEPERTARALRAHWARAGG